MKYNQEKSSQKVLTMKKYYDILYLYTKRKQKVSKKKGGFYEYDRGKIKKFKD